MNEPVLIVVFLRGGIDGLNLVSPTADPHYIAARPESLRVLRGGDAPGIALVDQPADVDFRFHPAARSLAEYFASGELAVIHACGLTDGTRSHFDAEARMEQAATGAASGGWLGRWVEQAQPDGILPLLATSASVPDSFRGAHNVAVADRLEDLILAEGHGLAPQMRARLQEGFGAHPILGQPLAKLLELSVALERRIIAPDTGDLKPYTPQTPYPDTALSQPFKTIAQSLKLDLGLRVATVDFGGWDTHIAQEREFERQLTQLSTTLAAFWRDLGPQQDRTNIVIMSEFGRRLRSNTAGGTDHGFGNVMLALGPGVSGGRMLGHWPGLDNDQLNAGADLEITTDYRHVLAEVMTHHMKTQDLAAIFPDFQPSPLGLFS